MTPISIPANSAITSITTQGTNMTASRKTHHGIQVWFDGPHSQPHVSVFAVVKGGAA